MGGLASLFGGSSNKPQQTQITQHDKAVLSLKNQRDQLRKKMNLAATIVEKEVAAAKQFYAQGKREHALYCLRKKRLQENLLKQAEQNLSNIEEMINAIEFTQFQQKVFDSLKKGTQTLKDLQLSLDDVEDVILDTQEAIEHQSEINKLLSENLTSDDDADIMRELNELQELPQVDSKLASLPIAGKTATTTQSAPEKKVAVVETEENSSPRRMSIEYTQSNAQPPKQTTDVEMDSSDELAGLEEMPDVPKQPVNSDNGTSKSKKQAVLA